MKDTGAISKKLRFDVFKRDGFVCQYCGHTPPQVTLEVDHIQPKSKKGSNDINNLLTSCFDCNRGKAATELTQIPKSLQENRALLEERELQYSEYTKLLQKINKRLDKEIEQVNDVFKSYFPDKILSTNFRNVSIKTFLKNLTIIELCGFMNTACSIFYNKRKIGNSDDAIRYFCGICWNKIKNKGYPEKKEPEPKPYF